MDPDIFFVPEKPTTPPPSPVRHYDCVPKGTHIAQVIIIGLFSAFLGFISGFGTASKTKEEQFQQFLKDHAGQVILHPEAPRSP